MEVLFFSKIKLCYEKLILILAQAYKFKHKLENTLFMKTIILSLLHRLLENLSFFSFY